MKRRHFVSNGAYLLALGIVAPKMIFGKREMDTNWHIEQFLDKGLAQFTYAIVYDKKIILIDPARDANPFYQYAQDHAATIVGVIETHPHADFTSSHAEIQRTKNATVYASNKLNARYPHRAVKDGDVITLAKNLRLKIMDTPGHSPDSISIVLEDKDKDVAVFSGDALLFGDVGRPDLREYAGSAATQRNTLAKAMYHTIHQKFAKLDDNVIVYPAHGAGSLCGGTIRNVRSSTIGYEKANNYAFKDSTEEVFVATLLGDLPFIPKYFPYDVELNRQGANNQATNLQSIPYLANNFATEKDAIIIDTRTTSIIEQAYLPGVINIQDGTKFETWLGTIVAPKQKFYVIADTLENLQSVVKKTAKIGYEPHITGAFVYNRSNKFPYTFNNDVFAKNKSAYTIIDVRNPKEVKAEKIFSNAINIPLPQLSSQINMIPKDKPIVIHCASGYRSAIASSILRNDLPDATILDLGINVEKYK